MKLFTRLVTANHPVVASFAEDVSFQQEILWVLMDMAFVAFVGLQLELSEFVQFDRNNRWQTTRDSFHIGIRSSGVGTFRGHDCGTLTYSEDTNIGDVF